MSIKFSTENFFERKDLSMIQSSIEKMNHIQNCVPPYSLSASSNQPPAHSFVRSHARTITTNQKAIILFLLIEKFIALRANIGDGNFHFISYRVPKLLVWCLNERSELCCMDISMNLSISIHMYKDRAKRMNERTNEWASSWGNRRMAEVYACMIERICVVFIVAEKTIR